MIVLIYFWWQKLNLHVSWFYFLFLFSIIVGVFTEDKKWSNKKICRLFGTTCVSKLASNNYLKIKLTWSSSSDLRLQIANISRKVPALPSKRVCGSPHQTLTHTRLSLQPHWRWNHWANLGYCRIYLKNLSMREQEGGNQPFTSLLIQSVKVERDFREFGSERLLTLSVGGDYQLGMHQLVGVTNWMK